MFTPRVVYSTAFYVLCIALLVAARPSVMFDRSGNPKPFGIGKRKSVFAFGTACVGLAVLCFYTFALIDLVFNAVQAPTPQ